MILTIILISLLLLIFLLFTSVHIDLSYEKKYVLTVKYGLITVYKNQEKGYNDKGKVENTDKVELELKKIKSVITKAKRILQELRSTAKKHFVIKSITIKYSFGFDDAAITGMFSGVAYSVIYSLMGYVDSNFNLKNKEVLISPDFDNNCQKFEFGCQCKIKLYYLLKSGINILKIWLN